MPTLPNKFLHTKYYDEVHSVSSPFKHWEVIQLSKFLLKAMCVAILLEASHRLKIPYSKQLGPKMFWIWTFLKKYIYIYCNICKYLMRFLGDRTQALTQVHLCFIYPLHTVWSLFQTLILMVFKQSSMVQSFPLVALCQCSKCF